MTARVLAIGLVIGLSQWGSGPISLPSNAIILMVSGTCPIGTTEAAELVNRGLVVTSVAGGLAGGTGGADAITPQGSVSASTVSWSAGVPTFSGTLSANGHVAIGFSLARVPVTSTTTSTIANSTNRLADATAGNITLTMPVAASTVNYEISITKIDASANTVTISPQAGGTLGGAATIVLTAQFQSVTLRNINSAVAGAWVVVGKT